MQARQAREHVSMYARQHASMQFSRLAKNINLLFWVYKKINSFLPFDTQIFHSKIYKLCGTFYERGGTNLVKRTGTNERTRERRGVKNWKFRVNLLFGWRPSKNCILFSIGTLNVQHSRAKFVFEKIKFQVLHLFANSQGSLKIRLAFQNCY